MSQGLKPHRHTYVNDRTVEYYDKKQHLNIRKVFYYCPICAMYGIDRAYCERFEYKKKSNKQYRNE